MGLVLTDPNLVESSTFIFYIMSRASTVISTINWTNIIRRFYKIKIAT